MHIEMHQVTGMKFTGEVGDAVLVRPGIGLKDFPLDFPDGTRVSIPFLIGTITGISRMESWPKFPVYEFEAIIDMEDGTFCMAKGESSPEIPVSRFLLSPLKEHRRLKMSDYHAYRKYVEEHTAAIEAFEKEWEEKNPIKLI